MKELVSVIVPVYNCELFIKRLVMSVLNQSYQNLELIVLNDGSTDNTMGILNQFKDSRLRIIDKENTGVSDTRNKGLKLAKGKYICFFDADDYVEPTFLEDCISLLEKYDLDLVITGFFSEVENKKQNTVDCISMADKLYVNKKSIKEGLVQMWDTHMLYNIWNKVYLKKIIDDYDIEFPNYNWGEDIEFNRNYLLHTGKIYNIQNCYYHYIRERVGAVTKKYKEDLFEIRKKEFYEFNSYFNKWNISQEDYYEFSCRRFIERLLGCIENVYCSDFNFKNKYNEIRNIINDPLTRETVRYVIPKSKKVKIMLIPIRLRSTLLAMFMGRLFHFVKNSFPAVFNKLKNRR